MRVLRSHGIGYQSHGYTWRVPCNCRCSSWSGMCWRPTVPSWTRSLTDARSSASATKSLIPPLLNFSLKLMTNCLAQHWTTYTTFYKLTRSNWNYLQSALTHTQQNSFINKTSHLNHNDFIIRMLWHLLVTVVFFLHFATLSHLHFISCISCVCQLSS